MNRFPYVAAALFVHACQHDPTPQEALQAYGEALARGDAEALRALSDEDFRASWSEARLTRWLKKNPRLLDETLARLAKGQLREEAIVETDGAPIRLVREPDGWRVAAGGLMVARFDTPEAALETFFFAATGHLGLLRKTIPDEAAARFATDFSLGKHLHAERARIFAARDALGPLEPGMAEVEGDRARIPYGEGKSVELVRQGERWRVLDLE